MIRLFRSPRHIFPLLGLLFAIILSSTIVVQAETPNSGSTTIVATVEPTRIIVVDKDLTIIQIISNTPDDVRPEVVLGSADGQEVPYSDSIRQQYTTLSPSINYRNAGTVYQSDGRYLPNVLARFWGYLSRWL